MDDPSYEYQASWSDNNDAWVGRCDGFLLVSHLAPTEAEALDGIRALVADIVSDLRPMASRCPLQFPGSGTMRRGSTVRLLGAASSGPRAQS